MRPRHPHREFAFLINDVARLFRTLADQEVSRLGMTRAQWAVLSRIERNEGLKQSEIAEMLDLQPITLTRLLDRLCDSGLIERRADPQDRRARRLYLTPAAKPLADTLDNLGREFLQTVLAGIGPERIETLLSELGVVKDNVRRALNTKNPTDEERKRYG